MKKIILMGTGKAGLIHYKSYKKMGVDKDLIFVDINKNSNYFKHEVIYTSLGEAFARNNLNANNVIVDIAVPKDAFYQVIEQCKTFGIKNIIVEKPFVLKNKEDFNELNIVMVENYLYSKIFKYIKTFIKDNDLKISSIYSNFSKNRKQNSVDKRGMVKEVVNCFNIEMPHQIYMTQDLINKDPQLLFKHANDMVVGDIVLKNHGEGLLILKYNDVVTYTYSNLMTDSLEKYIVVTTKDNYVIRGDFFTYTPDLNVIKKGGVQIYKNGELINQIEFEEDDMMTYMLQEFIDYFNENKKDGIYRQRIEEFSNFYNKYDL